MATNRRFEIAELFPQPKEVILGEGISELAMDVRLSTSNVLPVQRKALRSILMLAGVRVVANKKKYVVDAQVLGPEAFDLSKVPAALQHDFYELEVKDSEVFIRTPYQDGMVWAAQTLAILFGMMFNGRAVPNMVIHDWPVVPNRGLILDANWGTERMASLDWFQALDSMSAMHLNLCGISIYDCCSSIRTSQSDRSSEFLLTNIHLEPGPNEPASKSRFRYYNVKYDRWYDRDDSPSLVENDNFEEVQVYGRERGVKIFPVMNLMGHSTLLPRLIPALSACDEKGKPTGYGLCLSSPAAKKALEEFIGSFLERYYEDGVEYFHLGFDDLSDIYPHAADALPESVWCKCSKCKKASHSKLFAQFLRWIVDFLTSKGVEKVVFYTDELLQGEKLLGADLEALLKDKDFASKIILDWEDLGNETKSKVWKSNDPKFKNVTAWQTPLANRGNYGAFSRNLENVDAVVARALKEKSDGVIARGQYDPAYLEQLALLGVRCWETPDWKEDTIDALRKRWAELKWGGVADRYLEVLDRLAALSNDSVHQLLLTWNYLGIRPGAKKDFLKAYPADALDALAAKKVTTAQVQKMADEAVALVEMTAGLMGEERWDDLHRISLQSILASAQRIRIQAEFFVTLLKVKEALSKKSGGSAAAQKLLTAAIPVLLEELKVIEENMPDSLMWITMQQLGLQKLFYEEFINDLKAKTPVAKLTWTLSKGWEVPEDL